MSTTSLFVELVVIGVGAAVWLALAVLSVFGCAWLPPPSSIALPALVPALALMYVLGIVVDRIADDLFQPWDGRLRWKRFRAADDYQRARTIVYDQSDSLRDWFQYNRSRLRICRGWVINSLLCILSANAFIWLQMDGGPRWAVSLFTTVALALLTAGLCSAWHRLADGEYKRLWEEYSFAREEKARQQVIQLTVANQGQQPSTPTAAGPAGI